MEGLIQKGGGRAGQGRAREEVEEGGRAGQGKEREVEGGGGGEGKDVFDVPLGWTNGSLTHWQGILICTQLGCKHTQTQT